MAKVSVKGVLVGGVVDLTASVLASIVLLIVLSLITGFEQTPKDQFHIVLSRMLHESVTVHAAELVAGFACTALGGFVAASMAKHDFLLNGAFASLTCLLLDLFGERPSFVAGPSRHLRGYSLMGLLGGYLKKVQVRKKAMRSGL